MESMSSLRRISCQWGIAAAALWASAASTAAPLPSDCKAMRDLPVVRAQCHSPPSDTGGLCSASEPSLLLVGVDGTASGALNICNDASRPIAPALSLDAVYGGPCLGTPLLSATMASEIDTANAGDALDASGALKPGRCIAATMKATRLTQAGLMTWDVAANGQSLARVKALRQDVPFHLTADGPSPDKVSVSLRDGQDGRIRVRNGDPMSYLFRWRFELGAFSRSGLEWIAPHGEVDLVFDTREAKDNKSGDRAGLAIGLLDSGFIRNGTMNGRLLLQYEPDPSLRHLALRSLSLPVQADLNYWKSGTTQKLVTLVGVFSAVLMGIVVSLLVNYALPIQRKRIALKQRLADQEGRMIGLSNVVDSRTLGLLRSEKRRLRAELQSLSPILPATEAALPKVEARIDSLEQRIDFTAKAGAQLRAVKLATDLAESERAAIAACCHLVLELVKKAALDTDDIKTAGAQLAIAARLHADASQPPSRDAVGALLARATDFQQKTLVYDTNDPAAVALWQPFEELLLSLKKAFVQAPQLSRQDYVRASAAVMKADHVFRFNRLLAEAGNAKVAERRARRAADLLAALLPGNDESAERAHCILRQIEEGIGADDLAMSLAAPNTPPRIEVDPPAPLARQLVTFRICMPQRGQNSATARNDIPCAWFVDGRLQPEAEGWAWSTYFEAPGVSFPATRSEFAQHMKRLWRWVFRRPPMRPAPFQISAELRPAGVTPLIITAPPVQLDVPKAYGESSTTYAVVTLLITVITVSIGLLATAQDKLQSLDWITGLGALLLLGFSADALKRVLTRQ